VEISKTGSISKAAQNLFMTQPSLSTAISKLEEELQIEIFERGSKGIQFTPEGAELLGYARQLLDQVETIKKRFSGKKNEETVRFSVSTQHYAFAVYAFILFLNSQGDKSFDLHLREGKTKEIIDDVFSQKSSLGVIFLSSSTNRLMRRILNEKGIEFHHLMTVRPHVFVNKKHPLTAYEKVSLSQLEPYPCLTYEQGLDSFNLAEEVVSPGQLRQRVFVKDRASTVNIIRHTNAYNIGTGFLLSGIVDDSMTSIPIDDYNDNMHLGWIKLKNSEMTPEIKSYVEYLHEALKKCHFGLGSGHIANDSIELSTEQRGLSERIKREK